MENKELKKLAESVIEALPSCDLEEILFMSRVLSQTIDMVDLMNSDDQEAMMICDSIEQSMLTEVQQRVNRGEAEIKDKEKFIDSLGNLKVLSVKTLKISHSLYRTIFGSSRDQETKDILLDSAGKIEEEFFKRGVMFTPIGYSKLGEVPTPQEIIDGVSPSDIPNN